VRQWGVRRFVGLALGCLSLLLAARGAERIALFVGITSAGAQAEFAPAPIAEADAERVELVDTRRVVPSAGLPPQVQVMDANNNLDAVRHTDGRVYLAFRSAPNHFASPDTAIYVVSSRDERTWDFEARFAIGTDLREPRLLSQGGRLFLYVSKLGKRPYAFEPAGVFVTEKVVAAGAARWSDLEELDLPGHIVWRVKNVAGRGWMTAYRGAANLYRFTGEPMTVTLFASDDGRHWSPADPSHPDVYRGGVSETEFEFASDGSLLGVGRNEAGDERSGYGSVVCQAPAGAPADWSCRSDPRKFDSPMMFSHAGEVYLVARRTANADGAYDHGFGWGMLRSITNQLAYISTAKRCSLFHVVRSESGAGPRVSFVMDLPSRGDTCFPARVEGGAEADEVVLYNYSSDITGPDVAWSVGQRRPTYIYRHVLRFRSVRQALESTPTPGAAASLGAPRG
jgi:hypothetical protein